MLKIAFMILAALGAVGLCLQTGAFQGLGWLWQLPLGFLGSYVVLLAALFAMVLVMTWLVDMEKPQRKDNGFYRAVTHGAISVVMPLLGIRLHTEGLEKMPREGRCMVVCNHLFDLDPVFLLTAFPEKQLAFISKRENRKLFVVGPFLHKMLGQPINRENDREALKTILNCVGLIKEDKASVAVFPEGYVSKDKKLHPFRNGVFKIAQKANVPIAVCTLRDTHKIMPNFKRLKPTHVQLHLVGVIPAEELKGVTAVQIGQRVHDMMARDLGPALVLAPETDSQPKIPDTP